MIIKIKVNIKNVKVCRYILPLHAKTAEEVLMKFDIDEI